jgi:hypothetical protein
MFKNKTISKNVLQNGATRVSQGHLLEIHLLESRLLDTIFQNVICSTAKLSSARQQNKKIRKIR